MVIQLQAFVAYQVLQMPLQELNNQVVDADLIFGEEINILREEILNTKKLF